jgi:hypothetical protein
MRVNSIRSFLNNGFLLSTFLFFSSSFTRKISVEKLSSEHIIVFECDWSAERHASATLDYSQLVRAHVFQSESQELFNVTSIEIRNIKGSIADEDNDSAYFKKTKAVIRKTTKTSDSFDSSIFSPAKTLTHREVFWSGVLSDFNEHSNEESNSSFARTGFANVYQTFNGDLAGSFSTEKAAYSLAKLPNGTYQIRITRWEDFPDSEIVETSTNETGVGTEQKEKHPQASERSSFRFPSFTRQSSDTVQDYVEAVTHLSLDGTEEVETDGLGSVIPSDLQTSGIPSTRFLRGSQIEKAVVRKYGSNSTFVQTLSSRRRIQQDSLLYVDILIIVTNRAMCQYAGVSMGCDTQTYRGPIEQRIPVLEVETNNAFADVDLPVRIRVVDTIILQPGYDGVPNSQVLNVINSNTNVRQWRRDAGADLVAMITGPNNPICGIAILNSFESATSYTCLDDFVFSHEIGHNFGCLHDRDNTPRFQSHPYAHGYRHNVDEFRTIMAYECRSRRCPLVPYFFVNGYQLTDGRPIGDTRHDNARMIRENAPRVSNFVPSKQPQQPSPPPPTAPTSPTTPTSPLPNPPSPPSPTNPPNRPRTTCPPSSRCQASTNLMSRRIFFGLFCLDDCIAESDVANRQRRGWRCGGC